MCLKMFRQFCLSLNMLKWVWNIVNWTFRNKLQWNFIQNSHIFVEENAFETGQNDGHLSQPQCSKGVLCYMRKYWHGWLFFILFIYATCINKSFWCVIIKYEILHFRFGIDIGNNSNSVQQHPLYPHYRKLNAWFACSIKILGLISKCRWSIWMFNYRMGIHGSVMLAASDVISSYQWVSARRGNSSALTMELCLPFTKPLVFGFDNHHFFLTLSHWYLVLITITLDVIIRFNCVLKYDINSPTT